MVVLDRKRHQTTDDKEERSMRTQLQNGFSCPKHDSDAIEFAHNMVEPTLLPDVIRSVDKLMKRSER